MDYKLSTKNKSGKWWTYGGIKTNQWGNNQASFKVSALKELIELAESKNTEWVNLSLFDNIAKPATAKPGEKANTSTTNNEFHNNTDTDLDDEIPF